MGTDTLEIPEAVAVAGFHSARIITPAWIHDPKRPAEFEFTAASTAMDIEALQRFYRPDSAMIIGRYVQATIPNSNGHEFGAEDLIKHHPTIVNSPLNMVHRHDENVGVFVHTAMAHPTAGDAPNLGAPWTDAASLFWKRAQPEKWGKVMAAARQGLLWYSMEAVGRTVTCRNDGCCGKTFPFRGVYDPSYCPPMRKPGGHLRINGPFFLGGALILPPTGPGWRHANIEHIVASVTRHAAEAELIYEAFAARSGHLRPRDWEDMMHAVLCDTYSDEPVPVVTASRMPEMARADDLAGALAELAPGFDTDIRVAAEQMGVPFLADNPAVDGEPGAMVCITIPGDAATELVESTGATEPVEQQHITLVYLGKLTDDGEGNMVLADTGMAAGRIEVVVGAIAAAFGHPLHAVISGLGRWPEGDPDTSTTECTVALVDAPGLNEFRAQLVGGLEAAGITFVNNHGFTPHATLHYGPPNSGPKTVPKVAFEIDEVSIWWGGERVHFPLGAVVE